MCRKHLLKRFTKKMWRRYKYHLLYLSSLLLLYSFLHLPDANSLVKKTSVNLQYVTVHFDLKGSPPKLSYMASFLPTLSNYGVTSILLEYEDMFPYEGSIVNLSSKNSYKRKGLLKLIKKANSLNMEIIPLIQTFGHMQFILKLKEFAHLREQKTSEENICPSNPLSRELITTMLKQVIDLHATIKPLKHIHIGCDEVTVINNCEICKKRKLTNLTLFVNHVNEVASIVKELSPATKVLIWGDMLLEVKKPETLTFNDVEAVAWFYNAHPNFSHKYFYNLHKNFKNIWIASAFKGADGKIAKITDIKHRFQNHLSWMRFISDYKFGGEKSVYNFKGIILTGWSRYNHFAPQCELLPVAMPSLILNLLLINAVKKGVDEGDLHLPYCEFFKKYLNKEFTEIYQNYGDTDEKCAFENTFHDTEQKSIFNTTLLNNCLSSLYKHKLKCRSVGRIMDTDTLASSFALCAKSLKTLSETAKTLESFMDQYYKTHVIKSYIDQIVQDPTNTVKTTMYYILLNCTRYGLRT